MWICQRSAARQRAVPPPPALAAGALRKARRSSFQPTFHPPKARESRSSAIKGLGRESAPWRQEPIVADIGSSKKQAAHQVHSPLRRCGSRGHFIPKAPPRSTGLCPLRDVSEGKFAAFRQSLRGARRTSGEPGGACWRPSEHSVRPKEHLERPEVRSRRPEERLPTLTHIHAHLHAFKEWTAASCRRKRLRTQAATSGHERSFRQLWAAMGGLWGGRPVKGALARSALCGDRRVETVSEKTPPSCTPRHGDEADANHQGRRFQPGPGVEATFLHAAVEHFRSSVHSQPTTAFVPASSRVCVTGHAQGLPSGAHQSPPQLISPSGSQAVSSAVSSARKSAAALARAVHR